MKKVIQNSTSANCAPGISLRAMTQAIIIAIGIEIPWTKPVTVSVFKKALRMPGSLNAAIQEAKLYAAAPLPPLFCRLDTSKR